MLYCNPSMEIHMNCSYKFIIFVENYFFSCYTVLNVIHGYIGKKLIEITQQINYEHKNPKTLSRTSFNYVVPESLSHVNVNRVPTHSPHSISSPVVSIHIRDLIHRLIL